MKCLLSHVVVLTPMAGSAPPTWAGLNMQLLPCSSSALCCSCCLWDQEKALVQPGTGYGYSSSGDS